MTQTPVLADDSRNRTIHLVLDAQYGADRSARVLDPLRQHYSKTVTADLWPKLTKLLDLSIPPPQIWVVHSMQSMPRFFGFRTGEALVYDQHLGQVFSQLTRITTLDIAPDLVDAYLAKLVAIRLLLRGRLQDAGSFAIVYVTRTNDLRTARQAAALGHPPSRVGAHHLLVEAQERFVLGHELAHYVQRAQPEAFEAFVADMLEVLNMWVEGSQARPDPPDEDGIRQAMYRASIEEAWERRHGPVSEEAKRRRREVLPSRYRPEQAATDEWTRPGRLRDAVAQNETLRTEIACDAIAMLTVLLNATTEESLTFEVGAAALALHHLRLLQFLDDVTEQQLLGETSSLTVNESVTRLSVFRALVSGFSSIFYGPSSDVPDLLHRQITEMNLAHSKVIGDQFLFHTASIFKDVLAEGPAIWAASGDQVVGAEDLRELLGFGGS